MVTKLLCLIRLLKYILILSNCVIILDAIFLLISEKDLYQGEYIAGRHPVSHLLIAMLKLDLQSILMILVAVIGIFGVKNRDHILVSIYALIIALIAAFSVDDTDAFIFEVIIVIASLFYSVLIKNYDQFSSDHSIPYIKTVNNV